MKLFKRRSSSRIFEDIHALLIASNVRREEQTLSFRGLVGETRIAVSPSRNGAPNGPEISETIRIESVVNMQLPNEMECGLNMQASTGALVVEDDGKFRIKSRFSVYAGEGDDVVRRYAGLLFFVAVTHTDALQAAVVDAWQLPVSKAQRLDSVSDRGWKSISFSQATAMLNESGAFANGDETGLTAEFPFDHGAISAGNVLNEGFSKRTSLLQIQCEEHPNLGAGLLCRLELPLLVEDSEARRHAMSLNRMEATTDDWPPFLGAWTSKPKSGRPTFVSFWSDSFANAIGVETIATWMADRARRISLPLEGNAGLMPDTDDAMIYSVALGVTLTGRSTISSLYRKSLQSMAAQRGIQPREVQSVLWHAACALFPESYKTPNNRATIDQIWQKAANGQIAFGQARQEIFEFGGGFKKAAVAEPSFEG